MNALHVVVMGVSGCGKSAVGQRLADALGLPLIEGDSFHSAGNIAKMQQGMALTDDDRAGWLAALGQELSRHPGGAVLTCSALKRSYRDSLRAAAPGLRFVHLALSQQDALQRVAGRAGHFYPPSLVASQFEALEDPAGEPGVIAVDALLPLSVVTDQALRSLRKGKGFNNP
jgi:gluconokinase